MVRDEGNSQKLDSAMGSQQLSLGTVVVWCRVVAATSLKSRRGDFDFESGPPAEPSSAQPSLGILLRHRFGQWLSSASSTTTSAFIQLLCNQAVQVKIIIKCHLISIVATLHCTVLKVSAQPQSHLIIRATYAERGECKMRLKAMMLIYAHL